MTAARQPANSSELVTRLRRIEGQVRGIQHMIDRDEPFVDVITQVAAARAALAAVAVGVLERRIQAERSAPPSREVLTAVERLVHL